MPALPRRCCTPQGWKRSEPAMYARATSPGKPIDALRGRHGAQRKSPPSLDRSGAAEGGEDCPKAADARASVAKSPQPPSDASTEPTTAGVGEWASAVPPCEP